MNLFDALSPWQGQTEIMDFKWSFSSGPFGMMP